MGSDKDRFLIEPEVHNGQLCALGYGCVIRILLTGANAQWGSKYYALTGNAPADPRRGECAARYGCFDGETVMSCAGKPDCNGGPVPELASDLIQNMLPTDRLTIQLSRTIQLRPLDGEGGPGENAPCAYLYDRDCNPKVRILVFDCPADTNLLSAAGLLRGREHLAWYSCISCLPDHARARRGHTCRPALACRQADCHPGVVL